MPAEPAVEKPRSLTAAWVALALLLAVLGWFKWNSERNKTFCRLTTRNVQQAVRSYCGMNGLYLGDPINKSDLFGPGKFIESEPLRCAGGGTYTCLSVQPDVGDLYLRCSDRKHQLDAALIKDW
jgi:hypothetical protein